MAASRGKWLGFSLIIVGTVFLLDSTGTFDIGDLIWTYWPLLLVLWGLAMLMRPGFRRTRAPFGQASAGIVQLERLRRRGRTGHLSLVHGRVRHDGLRRCQRGLPPGRTSRRRTQAHRERRVRRLPGDCSAGDCAGYHGPRTSGGCLRPRSETRRHLSLRQVHHSRI